MKVTDLKDLTAPLVIDYRGLTINLSYYSERYFSAEVQTQLRAMAERVDAQATPEARGDERARADAELLALLIASWDVRAADDQPLAITADAILPFGPILRGLIAREIFADIARPLAPAAS